jgi:hypothetical protein
VFLPRAHCHKLKDSIGQQFLSDESVGRRPSAIGFHRLGTTAAKASQVRIPPGNAIAANTHEQTRRTPTTSSQVLQRTLALRSFFQISASNSVALGTSPVTSVCIDGFVKARMVR